MNGREPELLALRLDELLQRLGGDEAAPASGSIAALVVAAAAALVAMAARRAPDWEDGSGIAAQAEQHRVRAAALAHDDAVAFAEARELLGGARGGDGDRALAGALERAAEVPLAIAQLAADVAVLAGVVAGRDGDAQADAAAAAALAEGAARAAAHLVEVNLAVLPGDERTVTAQAFARWAGDAAGQALVAARPGDTG